MRLALITAGAVAFLIGTAILTVTLWLYLGVGQQYGAAAAGTDFRIYVAGAAVALIFLLVSAGLLRALWRRG